MPYMLPADLLETPLCQNSLSGCGGLEVRQFVHWMFQKHPATPDLIMIEPFILHYRTGVLLSGFLLTMIQPRFHGSPGHRAVNLHTGQAGKHSLLEYQPCQFVSDNKLRNRF